ncbi:hypothetical protein B0J17DRAFT_354914 [Rhizoctonia solani]|nr:hypothetical protein B0J17DRAFT_354914 [Rhizoctonia solani]
MHIHNAVDGLTERWDETPKFVDLEDSQTMINVYCTRLAPVDARMYSPIAISAIPAMLRFLVPYVAPEAQDLLPLIIEHTIERAWEALVNGEEDNEHFIDYLGKILVTSSRLLHNFNDPKRLWDSNRHLIAQTFAQRDLIELVARGLLISLENDVPQTPSPDH